MNNHQKGYRRDRLVLETIAEWGVMDTEQIRLLHFPSARVAQRRLRVLADRGRLKRCREATEAPYAYFTGKYDAGRLALNWVRLWLTRRLKNWEVLESFDYGASTATILNTVTGAAKTFTVLHNATRKTWLGENAIIVYDTDQLKREAAKRICGELFTIEEIREGLRCIRQSRQIHS